MAAKSAYKSAYFGQLHGFPKEVVERMLTYQELQGKKRDISVFEANNSAHHLEGGFYWELTPEGSAFWNSVIRHRHFHVYFERYPRHPKHYQWPKTEKVIKS
jgi:hypothetical protein